MPYAPSAPTVGTKPLTRKPFVLAVAVLATLVAAIFLWLFLSASPAAADASGSTTIETSKTAQKKLRQLGLKVTGNGNASTSGRRWLLNVNDGSIQPSSSLAFAYHAPGNFKLKGKVKFRKKGKIRRVNRQMRLSNFVVVVAGGSSRVTARVGSLQMTIFNVGNIPDPPFNPISGEILLPNSKLTTTSDFKRVYRQKFGKNPPKTWGKLILDATLNLPEPTRVEPPEVERPAGALDIVSAEMTWRPRESWTCYLNPDRLVGGVTVPTTDGTSASGLVQTTPELYSQLQPPAETNQSGCPLKTLNFTFDFPAGMFESGWHDPETGRNWIKLSDDGLVIFKKPFAPFFIDLRLHDGEIDIQPDGGSLVFATTGPDHKPDPWVGERTVYANLRPDLGAAAETTTDPVNGDVTYEFAQIPGLNPSGPTAWEGNGFYPPGSYGGWISMSFTVDFPVAG